MRLSILPLAGLIWSLGSLGSAAIAQQTPSTNISTGTYAAGDRYISIANNGDRTCYQGFSDPPLENSITVGETTGSLRSHSSGLLAEGWFEYGTEIVLTLQGSTIRVTHGGHPVGDYEFYTQSLINESQVDTLQSCLNANQLFFETSPGYAVTRPRIQSPQALAALSSAYPDSPLPSGIYYANGTMNNNSRREVLNRNGELCIKSVEGPPSPYGGRENITISSISMLNGKMYVDATGNELVVHRGTNVPGYLGENATALDDGTRRSVWRLSQSYTPGQVGAALEQDELMRACVDASNAYSHSMEGALVYGRL